MDISTGVAEKLGASQKRLVGHSNQQHSREGETHSFTAAVVIQKCWRGLFERKFGQRVWYKLRSLQVRHRAAARLQNAARREAKRRRALNRTREETADRALSMIERILRAYSRLRKAKRAVRLRLELRSAIIIEKIQRGVSARHRYWSERGKRERHGAAQRIQRIFLIWRSKRRELSLRALSTHFSTCARCGTARPSEFVFDLQEALCLNCLLAMSTALSGRGQWLRPRGQLLGTMLPVKLKHHLDVSALRLQRWWRFQMSVSIKDEGTCASCCRSATHVDHALNQRICRRCAQLSRRLYNLAAGSRRVQTLIQYNIDESAARVIHTFWRAWRALRRWRLIQKATFLRATSAACVIQTSFRGMLSRTVTNSCVVTLSWLYMVALRFLRRRPGAWFIRLHDDLLSQVPQLLVGPRRWTFAEKPAHLGRSLTIQLVHEASALLATRIGRGGTARQRVSVIRLEATRRRLEVVRRRRALCDTAARLIQRVSRGFCDRREYTRRRHRRRCAQRVADLACDAEARAMDAAKIWNAHGGFLGCRSLGAAQLLGMSCGLLPASQDGSTTEYFRSFALACADHRPKESWVHLQAHTLRPSTLRDTLMQGEILFRVVMAPGKHFSRGCEEASSVRIYDPPKELEVVRPSRLSVLSPKMKSDRNAVTVQSLSLFPVELSLHVVAAALGSRRGGVEPCCVIISWCGDIYGESKAPPNWGGNGSSVIERRDVFYLPCDRDRKPEFFGLAASTMPPLRLSLQPSEISLNGDRSHSVSLSPDALLSSFGARTTFSITPKGCRSELLVSEDHLYGLPQDDRYASITLLLTAETSARTESRHVIASILFNLLEELLHALPASVPHVKCAVIAFEPAHVVGLNSWTASCARRGVQARLLWNGFSTGGICIPIVDSRSFSKVRDAAGKKIKYCREQFVLPIDPAPIARGSHGDVTAIADKRGLQLAVEIVPSVAGSPFGVASLDETYFGEQEVETHVPVRAVSHAKIAKAHSRTPELGQLHLYLTLHRLPIPQWRQRQRAVESYVKRMIKDALRRVPQPRVEIALECVSDLLPDVDNDTLKCRVIWDDNLAATWRARDATDSTRVPAHHQRWADAGRTLRLFLPAHGLTVPNLRLELHGTFKKTGIEHSAHQSQFECLGVCFVCGSDLAVTAGRIGLDLLEPNEASLSRRSVVPQINRLVPGRVSISVDAIDIPLNTNHSTLDAESLPNLQVSILDLDIIDHQSSLVRDPTSHHDL